jgi:hypothetical protein
MADKPLPQGHPKGRLELKLAGLNRDGILGAAQSVLEVPA